MCFTDFFKTLIFWVATKVKRQKMAQNDKKNSLLHLIFQESYLIWSSFMVRICKSRISPGAVYIFSKVEFSGSIVRLKGKKRPKYDKKLSVALQISGSINMIVIFSTHVWNDDIYRCWFQFLKVLLFRVVSAENVKKILSHSISQEPYLMRLWFLVHFCKMMISPAIFFSFSKFWCFGRLEGVVW